MKNFIKGFKDSCNSEAVGYAVGVFTVGGAGLATLLIIGALSIKTLHWLGLQ